MMSPSEYARKITTRYNLSGRFNMDTLIDQLGGYIKYIPFLEYDAVIKKHEETFVILVNSNQPITRQRFSIAHEIGHLFLHLGYENKVFWASMDEEDSIRLRDGISFEEREANQFAAELLMPAREFINIANKYYDDNIYYLSDIAKFFGTSVDAVNYRGINLGLWYH